MKQSDIATIILIASISVMAAYFVAGAIIKPASETKSVLTADPISATIDEPKASIFNKDAINPTVEVTIGDE